MTPKKIQQRSQRINKKGSQKQSQFQREKAKQTPREKMHLARNKWIEQRAQIPNQNTRFYRKSKIKNLRMQKEGQQAPAMPSSTEAQKRCAVGSAAAMPGNMQPKRNEGDTF
jgi:hypothetical protein